MIRTTLALLLLYTTLPAQERVTPKESKPDHFRSVIYKNTGHEYLPEMKDEMVQWFERHLPVKK
jgi:hypothetical protein